MHYSTSIKIANRHSQTTPGWVVTDVTPNEWIEQVIKPLLADLTTPPQRIRFPDDREINPSPSIRDAKSAEFPVHFIGWIDLAIEPTPYNDQRYSRSWQHSLIVPLYWVNSTGAGQQVAIAPQRISGHSYYYTVSQLKELRYLAGPEGLRALLDAFLEQLRQKAFREQKVTKVRNLQTQAIQAQIQQLANEEQFAFNVTTTARLIQIAVRLDSNNQLTISVPFSEFEKVLPQLRETVIHLLALHQRRIRFKTHQCPYGGGRWIEPEPRPDADPASS